MSNFVQLEEKGAIGLVTINRPSRLNALNTNLLGELIESLHRISMSDGIRVVVLQSSSPKAFIAGADISEMIGLGQLEFRDYLGKFLELFETIENLTQPVIAKVAGCAFGGGCLTAFSCDLVIASENASFGQQEIDFGILGGTAVWPRLVGRHKAAEIVMLGEVFDVNEAYRLGVVNRIAPMDKLDEVTMEVAEKLAKKPALTLRMAKTSLRIGYNEHAGVAKPYERDLSCLAFEDPKGKENMGKFLSKSR